MLARTFLDARQLGITEKELAALIDVLGRLERGELRHIRGKPKRRWLRSPCQAGFNMSYFGPPVGHEQPNRDVVCCIGGWCDRLHGTNFYVAWWEDALPRQLLYVFTGPPDVDRVTPAEAANTLRHYLSTGECVWD